jgi:transcriptional regulator with XRE-family HTH domain
MPITALQVAHARALLGLTVPELSKRAGLAPQTLFQLEAGRSSQTLTRVVLRSALETAGVAFLGDGNVALTPRSPTLR